MNAGSQQSIVYTFFQFVDEIFHAVGFDNFEWGFNFCQWAHRLD